MLNRATRKIIAMREPPLRIGDIVKLNSGSPTLMVVDVDGAGGVVVARPDIDGSVMELALPAKCFHRVLPF